MISYYKLVPCVLLFILLAARFWPDYLLSAGLSESPLSLTNIDGYGSSTEISAREKFTIRVNTYRRLDLLKIFLSQYQACEAIEQVQVIWSDIENPPPLDWIANYPPGKLIFEVHVANNSLTNRFRPLQPLTTEAVFSVDDDLVVPCDELKRSHNVWKSNKNTMVGFSPRMAAIDRTDGRARYMRWQHTYFSGLYSIILTKAAFFHRDLLLTYVKEIPSSVNAYIDKRKNCEDIAMAYAVTLKTNAAPVWVQSVVYEIGSVGISSGGSHFTDRGQCIDLLNELYRERQKTKASNSHVTTERSTLVAIPPGATAVTTLGTSTSSATTPVVGAVQRRWPWITGYQKVVRLSLFEILYLK